MADRTKIVDQTIEHLDWTPECAECSAVAEIAATIHSPCGCNHVALLCRRCLADRVIPELRLHARIPRRCKECGARGLRGDPSMLSWEPLR